MKIAVIVPLVITCFQSARSQNTNADSAFAEKIKNLAHKRIEAFDLGDTSIWSPYVANEYIIATPTGKIVTKAEVMKSFGPPTPGYRDIFNFEDVHVIREGNVAVMSYLIKEHEWWGEQDNDVPDLRKTDTYILRNGNWQLLASHETFYPVVRTPISVNPTVFNKYTGRYRVMPSLIYTITKENNKLYIQENDNPAKTELLPLSLTTYFSQPNSGYFNEGGVGVAVFVLDKKGNVRHLSFRRYGTDIKAEKIN